MGWEKEEGMRAGDGGGGGGWLGKSLTVLQLYKEGKRRAKFGRDSRADR